MVAFGFIFALAALSSCFAHPIHQQASRELRLIGRDSSAIYRRQEAPASGFATLAEGNKAFREANADLLKQLADDGQSPEFMFLGCSDSRVSEGAIFGVSKPGTFFTERNIANQYLPNDPNAQSVVAYAVSVLGVEHIIVMGHYGCGGIAAAIASAPQGNVDSASGTVQSWIRPLRDIMATSTRPELVELRESLKLRAGEVIEEPDIEEPGFRALVEENVKVGVARMAASSTISNHYTALAANSTGTVERRSGEGGPLKNVFIHGWVYDIATGDVKDLNISVGPPGVAIPQAPWAAVSAAAEKASAAHEAPAQPSATPETPSAVHEAPAQPSAAPEAAEKPSVDHQAPPEPAVEARCSEQCKSKRSFLPRDH